MMADGAVAIWNVAMITALLLIFIAWSILRARRGHVPRLRSLPAMEAIDEAIGTAVAAGRPVLFVAGSRDMDSMQTIAGLSLLEPVARRVAEQGGDLVVPVNRSLVMEAARATCREAYAAVGHGDDWHDDSVTYISDDPLGFVARVDGMITRLNPGACFFFGFFASESLLLAEGARQVGSIQIAGTASAVQLPFFVASCDHVLLGEELFAARASLSTDAALMGSLRGQDLGKAFAVGSLLLGALIVTLAETTDWPLLDSARDLFMGFFETR